MKRSAGILLYRKRADAIEFLLVHPGGPFWQNKDDGAWSIPKGEYTETEDPLQAAIREFNEETGYVAEGQFIALSEVTLKSGKTIMAWALEKDVDPAMVQSNTFTMEWPPRSGKTQEFPEIDRASWFDTAAALLKINPAQSALIRELTSLL